MSAVWDYPCESSTQKLVLLALADNANDEGVCWPALNTIAKKCDLDKSNVCRHTKRLVKLGLVSVELRNGPNFGHISSRYTLKIPLSHGATPLVAVRDKASGGTRQPLVAVRDMNHQERTVKEPSKGDGTAPRVFPSEYKSLIEDAEREIEAIKGRGILNDNDRAEIKMFRLKIAGWKAKRFALA